MYACKVHYDGETFPCVETAFQYAKCADEHDHELFLNRRGFWCDGRVAKKIGRQVKLRSDWNEYRIDVMYKLLEDKFYHNEGLREALKSTGNRMLVEDNDWGDTFWGVCNGKGYNMLGKMLMEIRQTIQDFDREEKKVIVLTGRSFDDYDLMCKRLDFYFTNIKPIIICKDDSLAKKYADEHNYETKVYNPGAGDAAYIKNTEIAGQADLAVCFSNNKSKLVNHMIDVMQQLDKPVKVVDYV
jgi:ribA/ribD-fused uncharacterized protein